MVKTRTGIGQDSHRFLSPDSSKPLVIGGIIIDDIPGFKANSDGDIIFHALCNSITSVTGVSIMGAIADDLCLKDGITDSEVYVKEALKILGRQKIVHVALSIEGQRPFLKDYVEAIRENVARVLGLDISEVGLTATSGKGLTDFGCGDGMQCLCVITTVEE